MTPSIYQQAIYDKVLNDTCSISINAKAGSGKTTVLVNILELIPKNKKIIFLAFNKHIAEELKLKVPTNVEVYTLHKFGLLTIRNFLGGRIRLNEEKVFWLAVKMFDQWHVKENKFSYCFRVSKVVNFMRIYMVYHDQEMITEIMTKQGIPIFSSEIDHAIEVLKMSDKTIHKEIDFIDMLHIPASKNWKLKKYDYVLTDESQDFSTVQQCLIRKIINPINGRLISVGDPRQSIYSFMGADTNSYDNIKNIMGNTIELPLSVCYRCAKRIVREAQKIVPDIEAFEDNEEGEVREGDVDEIDIDSYVLCRNTKPLVQLFIYLLEKGIKANIKGKEIGENIINIIEKTKQTLIPKLLSHLSVERIRLTSKLEEKGVKKINNHPSMIDFNEKCEIIEILAARHNTVLELKNYIKTIFLDDEVKGVTLSTIHKTKGLEKDIVFFLNPELIPSKYASSEDDLIQEQNLLYVARTRSKKKLIYIRHWGDN